MQRKGYRLISYVACRGCISMQEKRKSASPPKWKKKLRSRFVILIKNDAHQLVSKNKSTRPKSHLAKPSQHTTRPGLFQHERHSNFLPHVCACTTIACQPAIALPFSVCRSPPHQTQRAVARAAVAHAAPNVHDKPPCLAEPLPRPRFRPAARVQRYCSP